MSTQRDCRKYSRASRGDDEWNAVGSTATATASTSHTFESADIVMVMVGWERMGDIDIPDWTLFMMDNVDHSGHHHAVLNGQCNVPYLLNVRVCL